MAGITPPVQTLPTPPVHIKANSYFSPRSRQCCQCNNRLPVYQTHKPPKGQPQICPEENGCGHQLCRDCPRLDGSGNQVIPHSFPVDWVCSTCTAVHPVLDILTMNVACPCEQPSLQAVYDQHGRIFLYWRDDPAVYDLTDTAKVQEAAWRIWEAGSEPWLPVVLEAEKRMIAEEEARKSIKFGADWKRFSQSSISTRDSLDIEMVKAN
ncbi:hypothetical protein QBC37DRAFT_169688 [Rhypophila decipiens]|uniref:Uncharacterized protein n=1 Tax=Rhypophila decipiens TaxID=261697 RepID=A0AAN6Y999_9PEZI|nr:hypothetical protein QBC37DRAFT_169688 [Rhypophila decipiens]